MTTCYEFTGWVQIQTLQYDNYPANSKIYNMKLPFIESYVRSWVV